MRRVIAIAVFSSLAISGDAQAPRSGPAWFAFIDTQGQVTNVRLIFPDGTELRAERMAVATGAADDAVRQLMSIQMPGLSAAKPVTREWVLSGDVRITFPEP